MKTFNNKILNDVKKHLNFTYAYVEVSNIDVNPRYFIYFNDYANRVELHSDKSYGFVQNGVLNEKTIAFSIYYKELDNNTVVITYNEKGGIINFEIGFFNPVWKFGHGDKVTSHSIKGEHIGLFTVKDGFKKYIKDVKKIYKPF